ncbi:MAG: carbohydrate kinase family protein [bacterium]|nr:carbohydrate kinase family protein [bacterium]
MKRGVLCFGGLALDYILLVPRLPGKNEAVDVQELSVTFGGAAANVAVTVAKLGGSAGLVAAAGKDFMSSGYRHYLFSLGIDLRGVLERDDMYMPRCFLVSRGDDQMIFYYEERQKVKEVLLENLGMLRELAKHYKILHFSTGDFEVYLQFLESYTKLPGQKISVDPGQQTFSETALAARLVQLADYVFMNEHEWKRLAEYFGVEHPGQLGKELVVVSRGEQGAVIYWQGKELAVPACRPARVEDPTGCGDAHRGAFLFALLAGLDVAKAARLASAVASFVVEARGAQTNLPDIRRAAERYENCFGEPLQMP